MILLAGLVLIILGLLAIIPFLDLSMAPRTKPAPSLADMNE